MDCPRCGASAVTTPECPACGVLVAKARPARPRSERSLPESPPPAAWRSLVLPGLGLVVLVAVAVVQLSRPGAAPAPPSAGPDTTLATGPAAPASQLEPPLPRALPTAPPPDFAPGPSAGGDGVTDADRAAADRLVGRLRVQARLSADDVRVAEGLYARYPAGARDLLEAVLLAAAASDQAARRFDSATAFVERAQSVAPQSPRPPRALLALRLDAGDWAGAEQAGRAFLTLQPGDPEAARGVAYSLLRQDRAREATELLTAFLATREDRETRALLDRLLHDQAPERNLEEAKLAHFHVRFDGDAHEDVGREILRVLDRHYATLARTFDYEPAAAIPVILLSRESYYDTTGAPAWSGGRYDSFDGRVRIPIGGLSASLSPELDETLIHELTHSFVADLSGGLAPRELHEGLAQYMEGKRMSQLDDERLRALADGRLRGVSGFYFFALCFVEDLIAQRGQGGVNDLLRAMASTGSASAGFRSVYGSDFETLKRQAAARLRQRHGS